MVRVTYTKVFLSGNLAGLSVPSGFNTPDSAHAQRHMAALNKFTPASPGSDCMSGSLFWCSCIGSEEVPA